MKLSDNLDLADDIFIERVQVLRWNPVFRMERAPDLLNAKATQVDSSSQTALQTS
jgi:hypothetical protein